MAKYLKSNGGLSAAQELSEMKSQLLYDVIDNSNNFYKCEVQPANRSCMNVTFRVIRLIGKFCCLLFFG